MSVKKPTIEQYLLSTCLFIIDEINEQYKNETKEQLRELSNNRYNEMDITVRLGYPFKQMVHYTVGDKGNKKSNHDLYVESKDFKIEVKFPKNWKSKSGVYNNKKLWSEYQKDFEWLFNEIKNGHKGKRAFIIGWFNCADYFSQIIQLGTETGLNPILNEERFSYFLKKLKASPTRVNDLAYNYHDAYQKLSMNIIGNEVVDCNCIFLGNEEDKFHFALYY